MKSVLRLEEEEISQALRQFVEEKTGEEAIAVHLHVSYGGGRPSFVANVTTVEREVAREEAASVAPTTEAQTAGDILGGAAGGDPVDRGSALEKGVGRRRRR